MFNLLKFKAFIYSCILLVTSLIFALLIGEFIIRVVFHRSMNFDMEMWKYATLVKMASDDPKLGHKHRPNCQAFLMGVEVTTNSFGMRGRQVLLKKPHDTYRIVLLGDSITMGWGVPQDKLYSTQLEKQLNIQIPEGFPSNMHYEVLNLGVGNYNTVQEVTSLYKIGLQFKPDLILLSYFLNDAELTPQPTSGFFIKNSYLYAFFISYLRTFQYNIGLLPSYKDYYSSLYVDNQPGWEAVKVALTKLSEIGKEHNIPIIIFIIPELHDLSSVTYPFMDIHKKLLLFGTSIKLPVIDLFYTFSDYSPEEKLWVSPTDAHPNALGHTIIYKGIYNALPKLINIKD
jgi:lysophospholipase L1-like esterase